ncbi:MAG: hypothetical protein H6639_07490 [Caldilineaceae bacterium]|nr:hypothetical protein [Caldilineaceae bacterium]
MEHDEARNSTHASAGGISHLQVRNAFWHDVLDIDQRCVLRPAIGDQPGDGGKDLNSDDAG